MIRTIRDLLMGGDGPQNDLLVFIMRSNLVHARCCNNTTLPSNRHLQHAAKDVIPTQSASVIQ